MTTEIIVIMIVTGISMIDHIMITILHVLNLEIVTITRKGTGNGTVNMIMEMDNKYYRPHIPLIILIKMITSQKLHIRLSKIPLKALRGLTHYQCLTNGLILWQSHAPTIMMRKHQLHFQESMTIWEDRRFLHLFLQNQTTCLTLIWI